MANNKTPNINILGLAWEVTTYVGIVISTLLALIYLFCENCREGVRELFTILPIHLAIAFIIFVCVNAIVFAINRYIKWRQNKKIKRDNLGDITNKGTMKDKAKTNLPPIECLGCGQPIKLPKRITTIENYDGQITCKKCWALLAIEKVGNEIPRYKLVREGKGRPVEKVELNVVYDRKALPDNTQLPDN